VVLECNGLRKKHGDFSGRYRSASFCVDAEPLDSPRRVRLFVVNGDFLGKTIVQIPNR